MLQYYTKGNTALASPKKVLKILHILKSFTRETESAKDLICSFTWKLFENETGLPVPNLGWKDHLITHMLFSQEEMGLKQESLHFCSSFPLKLICDSIWHKETVVSIKLSHKWEALFKALSSLNHQPQNLEYQRVSNCLILPTKK